MPVPLAVSLLSTVGPAVAKYIGARKSANELTQDPTQIGAQYDELKASMPEFGVGSAWNEYLAMSKQDPAADMQRQIAAEQEASAVGALKAGGAKALLGGLGAAQRQSAATRMGIEADSAKRRQAALGEYAGVQQAADTRNTLMAQNIAQSKFGAMRGAEQYNRMLEAGKKQALWDGLGSLAGSATSIYNAFQNRPNTGTTFEDAGFDVEKYTTSEGDVANPNLYRDAGDYEDMMSAYGGGNHKNGGMMTKGAFSHKTNPIDIVQDGAKVGEMTGGEAILNPEQQKKVAKQSPYFRKLMREFAMRNRK